ncbi:unnamed protein product [Miscanthus lutarioriparius]|uniref:Protein BIG GRAIN 1 n=1 Tax=Miscanthus lutarioriparius TaxID=422564 RepID=A0A811MBQ3_9POAL|nr:unnamed protein product [Miscanthus lutarioriparius]
MERWGDKDKGAAAAPGRARRYADQPSFSSTLLDAIYKSMDETGDAATPAAAATATKKQNQDLHYSYYYKASLAGSYRGSRAAAATALGPHAATTSSSSECSSYGGFSSSEAESSQHRRLRPIRTCVAAATAGAAATAPAPALAPEQKKKAGANIRTKLRDLRKPASPGARLAGFLNAIFNGRRAPQTPPSASASRGAAESACSTASSYSRSCLSKTPSTRGQPKRTVRFLDSDDGEAAAAVPARRVQVGVAELEQMLLHRMEMDSDEDDEDEESSDASSDLFDLENFAAVAPDAGAGAAAYRDELPVYETTRVVLGHVAIGHGYAHGRSTRVV